MNGLPSRARAVATGLLVVAGLVTIGRLANEAWLVKPMPRDLPTTEKDGAKPPPLFVGIVDGLRAEAVVGPEAVMPAWQGLASEGASGIGMTGEPTMTACCVRTILTGRNPDLVTAFRNFSAPVSEGSWLQFLVERGARAAHAGDAAAWQMSRPWIHERDVLAFPDRGPADQGGTDDQSFPFALGKAQDPDVDVLVVHVVRPDHAGHKHGATGPEYHEACAIVDGQLARLVEAFRRIRPEATVLLTADHGLTPRGNHGGGEPGARRAPFVLVGPRVARIADVLVPQASLAPTLCVLLGLPPPPLAEAPPVFELTTLAPSEQAEALDAYLRARIEVAHRIGASDIASAIDTRRAQIFVDREERPLARLMDEWRALEAAAFTSHGAMEVVLALALSLSWLLALARLSSPGARGRLEDRGVLVASVLALGLVSVLPPTGAAIALFLACVGVGLRPAGPPGDGVRRLVLAGVVSLPILGGAGLLLQHAFDASDGAAAAARRLTVVLAVLAVAVGLALRTSERRRALQRLFEAHPVLLPLLAGLPLGFVLSLRPFVDPIVHTPILFAVGAIALLVAVVRARPALERAPRARVVVLGVGVVLFAGGRLLEGLSPDWLFSSMAVGPSWWIAASVGVAALVFAAWPRGDEGSLGAAPCLALLGLVAAAAVRYGIGPMTPSWWVCLASSLAALGLAAFRGTDERRLFARLVAFVALSSLLYERSDAQYTALVLLALGCLAASHLPSPRTRLAVAFAAVALLGVRIAIFHALGFLESESTIDTGAGIAPGIGATSAGGVPTGGGLTIEVGVQFVLHHLKFSLVWIALLSAVAHAWKREGRAAALPLLGADVALAFAVRGASVVLGMWVWWQQSWWVSVARPVFLIGLADVVLMLLALACVGGLRRSPRPGRAHEAPAPATALAGAAS